LYFVEINYVKMSCVVSIPLMIARMYKTFMGISLIMFQCQYS